MDNSVGRTRKTSRIDVRVNEDTKSLIERAACAMGQSVTDFVLNSAMEKSTRVISDTEVIRLSVRDSQRFLNALDANTAPNDKLMKAAAIYRNAVKTGSLKTIV
ncbi:MAG TPA: DUF1778 domain-containing protein [Myxococcota bacterium]|nr:DUF1778 domain-containing protein [Myxococcota bacterium]